MMQISRWNALIEFFRPYRVNRATINSKDRRDELTLQEALADPIVQAMMYADKVDPAELEALLREIGKSLSNDRAERF